jgi:hypothetical protein
MSLGRFARKLKFLCAPLALLLGLQSAVYGQVGCATCPHTHCPPCVVHCMKGPPKIKWKKGCPLPLCCPCDAPNWGYHQPCWRPWPWPPDWSHCPYPVPAAQVTPCPQSALGVQHGATNEVAPTLPTPRTLPNNSMPGS